MTIPPFAAGPLRLAATALVLSVTAATLVAAPQLPGAQAYGQSYRIDVAPRVNDGPELAVVDAQVVHVPGADSLRLAFDEIDLGPGDRLDVRSLADGQVHSITRDQIAPWNSTSAYLNGDTVIVELVLAAGSRGGWSLDSVLVGTGILVPFNICGADDRVASNDPRVTRILDNGGNWVCSGWLAPGECGFTAGHCLLNADIAQFNVPLSLQSGAIQHPPVEDQFPVDQSLLVGENVGVGQDWALYGLLSNALGEQAHSKYGWFQLVDQLPSPSAPVRVTGYGSDATTANYSQQTDTGLFITASGVVGSAIEFFVDTKPGSSGSPIIDESDGSVLGIVTNSGCGTPVAYNIGTSTLLSSLQQAYGGLCSSNSLLANFDVVPAVVEPGGTVHFRDSSSGSPIAWNWDLDGDGTTDSTNSSPSFSYGATGSYAVSLSIFDGALQDTQVEPGAVTVVSVTPVSAPYAMDFSGGLPADGAWSFATSAPAGLVDTVAFGSPSGGSGHPALGLATSVDGFDTTSEATLHLDVTGDSNVVVRYWYRETDDEDHPEDGVFLSDGVTEVLAQSHQGGPTEWTEFSFNVGQIAAAAGLQPTSDLRVIFRQRDNYNLGSDGVLIDDVSVEPGPTGPYLTGAPASVSVKLGGTQTLSIHAGAEHAGKLFLAAGSANGTSPASSIGGVVVPLVIDAYFMFTITEPDQGPLYDGVGYLDGAGFGSFRFELPMFSDAALVGLVLHHAAAIVDLDAVGGGSAAIEAVVGPVPVNLVL